MTPPPLSSALGELGASLRRLREQVGLTGAEFAAALGGTWRQPKVSKVETGRQLPTEAEIVEWAAAAAVDATPLLDLHGRAAAEFGTHRARIRRSGGEVAHQQEITASIEASTRYGSFAPAIVPGLLQTPGYLRGLAATHLHRDDGDLPVDAPGHVIAAKIRRQAILHEPGREFVHVVTEAALRLRIGAMSVNTLRGQLVHLAELATLPGHTFGVLPFATPCPVETLSGFQLYDRELVRVETNAGVLQLTDPEAVARHSRWLDQLVDASLTGTAAAGFCRDVAADLPDRPARGPVQPPGQERGTLGR